MASAEMTKRHAAEMKKSGEGRAPRPTVTPPVDIYENDDQLLLMADMPGTCKEKLSIDIDQGVLTIEGCRGDEAPEGTALEVEYRPLDYRRTFSLPDGIDTEKVCAEFTCGILRLTLPKAAEAKPKRIEIKAGA